jgi:hypothetical protein
LYNIIRAFRNWNFSTWMVGIMSDGSTYIKKRAAGSGNRDVEVYMGGTNNKNIADNVSAQWIAECRETARAVKLGDRFDELLAQFAAAFEQQRLAHVSRMHERQKPPPPPPPPPPRPSQEPQPPPPQPHSPPPTTAPSMQQPPELQRSQESVGTAGPPLRNNNLPDSLAHGVYWIGEQLGVAKHSQEGMAFEIHMDQNVETNASVFFVLPGAGVEIKTLRDMCGKAPAPSWWVLCDVGDKGNKLGANAIAAKRRMPVFVPELLGKVKQWAGTARKVIVIGFSRGGAWGLDLVLKHHADLDAAVLIAAYPHTKNPEANFDESRQLMLVDRPVLLIHYTEDYWTNNITYPGWFAGFYHVMHKVIVTHSFQTGFRHALFSSISVPGEHDLGLQLQRSLDFGTLNSLEAAHWWHCICTTRESS